MIDVKESHWAPDVPPSNKTRRCVAVNQKSQWMPVPCLSKMPVVCHQGNTPVTPPYLTQTHTHTHTEKLLKFLYGPI